MTTITFWTATGVEVPAVTTDQVREIDRIAMETGPNLFQMMENAGHSLAEMTLECLGQILLPVPESTITLRSEVRSPL